MSATLRLVREGFGMELRRGKFDITVDGQPVGSLDYQQTVEVPVDPGHHALRLQHGRYASRTRSFDVTDGEAAAFRCHGAMAWPRFVASMVKPDLAISLRRE